MNRLIRRADSILQSEPSASVESNREYDADYESIHDFNSSGYGWTSIRTLYYKLIDDSSTYDYYLGEYVVSMEPDSGSFNSGLDVESSMTDGKMLKHGLKLLRELPQPVWI